MFILRFLRKLLFLALIGFGFYWIANYKVDGQPLYQTVKGFLSSGNYKEGVKDMRVFFGGLLKTMGEQIQEDVTEDERKQLDNMIQREMKK